MFVELLLNRDGKDLMKHYKFLIYFGRKKVEMMEQITTAITTNSKK
jgi:uncharacterized protein YqgQ